MADVPADLQGDERPRGGRRARSTPSPPSASSTTAAGGCARSRSSRSSCADGRFEPVPGHRARAAGRLRLPRDGLHRPERRPLLEQLGVELDERGNVARDRHYMIERRRRVRRRRRRPRPVAHRVGHRRGPLRRCRGRRLAVGQPPRCRRRSRRPRARSSSELLRPPRRTAVSRPVPLACNHASQDRVASCAAPRSSAPSGPLSASQEGIQPARRRRHGRRPDEPLPRRLRRPRAGLRAGSVRRPTPPDAASGSSSTCRARRSGSATSPTARCVLDAGQRSPSRSTTSPAT